MQYNIKNYYVGLTRIRFIEKSQQTVLRKLHASCRTESFVITESRCNMKTSSPKPFVSGLSIAAGELVQLSVYVYSESIFDT